MLATSCLLRLYFYCVFNVLSVYLKFMALSSSSESSPKSKAELSDLDPGGNQIGCVILMAEKICLILFGSLIPLTFYTVTKISIIMHPLCRLNNT